MVVRRNHHSGINKKNTTKLLYPVKTRTPEAKVFNYTGLTVKCIWLLPKRAIFTAVPPMQHSKYPSYITASTYRLYSLWTIRYTLWDMIDLTEKRWSPPPPITIPSFWNPWWLTTKFYGCMHSGCNVCTRFSVPRGITIVAWMANSTDWVCFSHRRAKGAREEYIMDTWGPLYRTM